MATESAFWFDWKYDREYSSSHSHGRYANYLGDRLGTFKEIESFGYDDPSVEFAVAAWRIANGPIMAPPLVHRHSRIVVAEMARSNWDGRLVAAVRLVVPAPQVLRNAKTWAGEYYRDFPGSTFGDGWDEPSGDDVAKHPYLLTESRLIWTMRDGILPVMSQVPQDRDSIYEHAVPCLQAIVTELNREVGPIIEALEGRRD